MSVSRSSTTDVLIVGAGPTGLALAGELLHRGVSCRIIDRALRPAQTSRALGLHGQTLETFAEMGIAAQALAAGVQVSHTNVLNGDRVIAHFSTVQPRRGPYPFMLLLPQSRTEELLAGRVVARGGRVERASELTDLCQDEEGVLAVVNGREEIRARWAVGCDGMHSCVREFLGVRFITAPSSALSSTLSPALESAASSESFLLADVAASWQRNRQETYIWLSRAGTFAALPLPGGDRWRLFAELPGDTEHPSPPRVSLELMQQLFAARTGDRQTRLAEPSWLGVFHIRRGVASDFRQGRVFLAGDAAHVQGPFGGQGMNAGIHDACNLAWKLAYVIQDVAAPDLLDTYQQERQAAAWAALSEPDEASGRAFPVQFTGRAGLSHGGQGGPGGALTPERIRAAVACEAIEPRVTYRDSPLSQGGPTAAASLAALLEDSGPQPGDRAPDAPCRRHPDGARTTLFQEWHGAEFRLLLFSSPSTNGHGAHALAAVAQIARARLGRRLAAWVIRDRQPGAMTTPADLPEPLAAILLDDGALRSAYHAPGEAVFLVRPDGYVAFHSCPASEKALAGYLDTVGVQPPVQAPENHWIDRAS